jgi:hypothetical protein
LLVSQSAQFAFFVMFPKYVRRPESFEIRASTTSKVPGSANLDVQLQIPAVRSSKRPQE